MERYKLGHLLGKGAFGDVFLATDRKTNRKVAIKKLAKGVIQDLAEMERSMQEFSILVSLGHKNVIQLIEVVSDAQSIGIVMEFAGAWCYQDGCLLVFFFFFSIPQPFSWVPGVVLYFAPFLLARLLMPVSSHSPPLYRIFNTTFSFLNRQVVALWQRP